MTPTGWQQTRQPAPGELWTSFQQRLAGYEDKLKGWNLAKALTAADVDAALAGSPRVLLATEGANFLEGQPERVAQAHAWGVRHLQLIHFIQSPLGDRQTAEPVHGGLTPLGAKVVAECRRLGIVVDMAHGTVPWWTGCWKRRMRYPCGRTPGSRRRAAAGPTPAISRARSRPPRRERSRRAAAPSACGRCA